MGFLVFWLGCAFASAVIASNKGRSALGWFFLGCLFGIFALIVIAVISSNKPAAALPGDPGFAPKEDQVRCPECRELILAEARKCKHCGSAVIPTSTRTGPF